MNEAPARDREENWRERASDIWKRFNDLGEREEE
jgi:hypothetical protein